MLQRSSSELPLDTRTLKPGIRKGAQEGQEVNRYSVAHREVRKWEAGGQNSSSGSEPPLDSSDLLNKTRSAERAKLLL